jgi:hypothetical protein
MRVNITMIGRTSLSFRDREQQHTRRGAGLHLSGTTISYQRDMQITKNQQVSCCQCKSVVVKNCHAIINLAATWLVICHNWRTIKVPPCVTLRCPGQTAGAALLAAALADRRHKAMVAWRAAVPRVPLLLAPPATAPADDVAMLENHWMLFDLFILAATARARLQSPLAGHPGWADPC